VDNSSPSFVTLVLKTIVVHTVTYFVCGILAFYFLDYAHTFAKPGVRDVMRQTNDPIVMAGPLFQPIRGLLFAIAFYPIRSVIFGRKHGWVALLYGTRIIVRPRVLLLTGLIALCSSQTQLAGATFLGSSVVVAAHYPTLSSAGNPIVGPVTVGPGVEFPGFVGNNQPPFYSWTSDVSAGTIGLTEVAVGNLLGNAAFNGFQYTFTGSPAISGVTFNPSSTLPITGLSFTANTVEINYANVGLVNGPVTTLVDVTFVPEPGSIILLFIGVFVFVFRYCQSD
jgi:hypothetical protein